MPKGKGDSPTTSPSGALDEDEIFDTLQAAQERGAIEVADAVALVESLSGRGRKTWLGGMTKDFGFASGSFKWPKSSPRDGWIYFSEAFREWGIVVKPRSK